MRKLVIGILLALACLPIANAGEDDARAIINKSIEAIGGEKAIKKHAAVLSTDKGTYYGMGDGLPYTGKYSIQFPDKFRLEIQDVFTMVLDGDKGWVSAAGEVKEMDKQQLATQRNDHRAGYMSSLVPLMDKAFMVKTLKEAKVGKKDTQVVEASRKDWPTMKLYFDKSTHYLAKIEFKTKAAELGYKEVTFDHLYSDYKEVDGVKVPHKMVMNRDGKVFIDSVVTSYKAVGKIDATVFAMPK